MLTAKWLTYGKQLQEVNMWAKLENPPPRDSFQYILNLEASLHSLLSFAWTLTRPTNFNLLRQNIVFSYSERIPVSFSWLFHYFSFFFCYFTLLLIFTKIILLFLFYYICVFFFHEHYFYFFMFRNVPGCSMFLVLSTPYRNAKKVVFCQLFLSCYVSLNCALFRYSSLNFKIYRLKWHQFETVRSQITE